MHLEKIKGGFKIFFKIFFDYLILILNKYSFILGIPFTLPRRMKKSYKSEDSTGEGKADLHVHTSYSGFSKVLFIPYPESVSSPKTMVNAAVKKKLDVLCITDHNEIEGAWKAQKYVREKGLDIDIVIGEEISTVDGEILGLFLQKRIPENLSAAETLDFIHEQGGLAIAPHPFSYFCPCLGKKVEELPLDGLEVLNGAHMDPYVNSLAQKLVKPGLAQTGGSDSHSPWMLGDAFTLFPGTTAEELYRSIVRRETKPGGRTTPILHWIEWTMGIAYGVFEEIVSPDVAHETDNPLAEITKMRRHNKIIALGGCLAFMGTPLPFFCGMVGEGWMRWKGKRKMREVIPLLDSY